LVKLNKKMAQDKNIIYILTNNGEAISWYDDNIKAINAMEKYAEELLFSDFSTDNVLNLTHNLDGSIDITEKYNYFIVSYENMKYNLRLNLLKMGE